MNSKKKKASIAEEVFKWLEERPCIQLCLFYNLINYSSLSRYIQKELKVKNFDAVIVAIRRYRKNLEKAVNLSKSIKNILKSSTLEIKTGINVYVIRDPATISNILKKLNESYLHIIKGYDYYLIITDKTLSEISKKYENLAEIRIKSPEKIESVPGVVFFIYQKLFERNINIVETYSCWTDTIILIEKKDLTKALDVFEKLGIR